MEKNLIRITGLWANKTKDNVQYLSGTWGSNLRVLIFKNKNKRPDSKDPDYSFCLAPIEPKESEVPKDESDDF